MSETSLLGYLLFQVIIEDEILRDEIHVTVKRAIEFGILSSNSKSEVLKAHYDIFFVKTFIAISVGFPPSLQIVICISFILFYILLTIWL